MAADIVCPLLDLHHLPLAQPRLDMHHCPSAYHSPSAGNVGSLEHLQRTQCQLTPHLISMPRIHTACSVQNTHPSCNPCLVHTFWHIASLKLKEIFGTRWGLAARKLLCGGGDGMGARRRRGGRGFQKWASVPGPLFRVRTVVATKGAGTQILDWKIFFHSKFFPHVCVVKMISATWGSF